MSFEFWGGMIAGAGCVVVGLGYDSGSAYVVALGAALLVVPYFLLVAGGEQPSDEVIPSEATACR